MDGDERRQAVLTGVPSLGGLYVRAAGSAVARGAGRAAARGAGRAVPGRRPGRDHRERPAGPGTRDAPALPAVEHVVEAVPVDAPGHEAFCRVVGARQRETAAGTEAFSGYLHTLAFPVAMSVLTRPDFPLPILGMVHLANEVEHLAAVTVDEDLTVTAHAEGLRPHRAGAQVDVVARLARGNGEPVWTGRSTYLAKGARVPGTIGDPPRQEFVPPAPTGSWRLPAGTGRNFAGVSGDWNPLHLSGPTAKALGMKGAIAHGMYCASRALADVGVPAGTPLRWTVRFAVPVLLPGTVSVAIDDDGRGPAWRASTYAGWDPCSRRPHFTGAVVRLGG